MTGIYAPFAARQQIEAERIMRTLFRAHSEQRCEHLRLVVEVVHDDNAQLEGGGRAHPTLSRIAKRGH
jgi:hypothetical protein